MEKISTEIILDSREARYCNQKKLIDKYNCPLISFTINTPGIEKNNEIIKSIFLMGIKEIENNVVFSKINVLDSEISILKISGPEAIYVIDKDIIELKLFAIEIENSHPLGRLFDIDIIDTSQQTISRENLDFTKRKCLLCDKPAKICSRAQTHRISELLNKFNEIYFDYINIK